MMVKQLLVTAAAVAGILGASQASASAIGSTVSFTLDQDGCSTGCSGGGFPPFGTVTLTQVSANTVSVDLTLAGSSIEFVKTGAGDAIEFNTDKAVTLSGITSGFTQDPGSPSASVFGSFDYG